MKCLYLQPMLSNNGLPILSDLWRHFKVLDWYDLKLWKFLEAWRELPAEAKEAKATSHLMAQLLDDEADDAPAWGPEIAANTCKSSALAKILWICYLNIFAHFFGSGLLHKDLLLLACLSIPERCLILFSIKWWYKLIVHDTRSVCMLQWNCNDVSRAL